MIPASPFAAWIEQSIAASQRVLTLVPVERAIEAAPEVKQRAIDLAKQLLELGRKRDARRVLLAAQRMATGLRNRAEVENAHAPTD